MARRSENIMVPDRKSKPRGVERGKQAEVGFEERMKDAQRGKERRLRRVRR